MYKQKYTLGMLHYLIISELFFRNPYMKSQMK